MARSRRSNSNFLWNRPGTSIIWFSRAVPKSAQELEGRKLIQFSLKTTDPGEAAALARLYASEQDERWGLRERNELRPQVKRVSQDDLDEAIVIVAHDLPLEESHDGMTSLRGKGENMWRGQIEWNALEIREQARLTATGDYSKVNEMANLVSEALGLRLNQSDPLFKELCDRLNEVRLDGLKVAQKRATGQRGAQSDHPLVRRVCQHQASRAKHGETIEELFERWAAECLAKGEKRPDTIDQDRKVIRQFAEFVGGARSVGSISAIEVAEYRDTCIELPPRWRSKKELRGLDMRAAAARARELGMARSAYTTVNKFLSTISPLYKWLAAQPSWAGLRNPCDGLFHTKVKGKNPRPPFSTAQLNSILGSPVFTGFEADGREHVPGPKHADDWRKWIMLVCMFTGARVGEVAQLRINDVRQERDLWLLHIREEEKVGLTTKNRKSHVVPLHSRLLAHGFDEFVERQRQDRGDDGPLFRGVERDSRGQFGKVARWYRDYLTAIGIKHGRDGVGMHSFRHTLADRMRTEAELLDSQIAVFLNHSLKSTTGGYGQLSQGTAKMMKGWIDSVTWEGVQFDALAKQPRRNEGAG